VNIVLHSFSGGVEIAADTDGLTVRSTRGQSDLSRRENWPADSLAAPAGWRTAIEIEQLIELGLAEVRDDKILVLYQNFQTIDSEMPVSFTKAWVQPSPFLLKIDRKSDIGRRDFEYKYQFFLGGRPVHLDRSGLYVRRAGANEVFILDHQMYSLVEAMNAFNALPAEQKTLQESWLTFAKIKGCANEVGAILDNTLQKNDVVVPSAIGLDMREDADGALSFLPKCPELATEEFHQVFERNPSAEKLYSLDRPGLGRVRIVLSDEQHEVLRRMKRVRRVTGETKERLKRDPVQVFDGVADHVELPYGDRVTGIGDFIFTPVPRPSVHANMAELWQDQIPPDTGDTPIDAQPSDTATAGVPNPGGFSGNGEIGDGSRREYPEGSATEKETDTNKDGSEPPVPHGQKVLLIETNEKSVKDAFRAEAERASLLSGQMEFQPPEAFREDLNLHPHQARGVQWLQTCVRSPGRRGVLLADDMGLGKTIQILTFLAWCIESGKFPELAKTAPPFRPILIIVPLILLGTRSWEKEMESFFANEGSIFWPILALHGSDLAKFRRADAEGPELDIGKPILKQARLQQYRVIITNYETLRNYQHSFAHFEDGKPLWSLIVSDEAQEYKIPSSKISHAMKALKADFQIACTGTPVENRLLDLWNVCDAIQPGLLSSANDFMGQFENEVDAETRDQRMEELKRKLLFQKPHAFLLRRNKSDIADLPAKHIVKISCEMSDTEIGLHQMLLRELQAENKASKFLTVLHRFAQLSQHPVLLTGGGEDAPPADLIAGSSKLRTIIDQLHKIRGTREKAIIFARHRAMQSILAKVLGSEFQLPVRIINGETKMNASSLRTQGAKTRNAILEEFKAKSGFNILILSPFVAGIGLTITEANHVFHYGRWWNPAVESQATDRTYRIGQTKEVFVYVPILRDPSGRVPLTFDERLDALMERKYRLAEDFLRPLPPEEDIGAELFGEL